MPEKKKFISMLIIELDDFLEDLSHMRDVHKLRYSQKEISEHVYKENNATLVEAQDGIEKIQQFLLNLKYDQFNNPEELAHHIKKELNRVFTDCAIPQMDQVFLNKKIDKILKYLSNDLV